MSQPGFWDWEERQNKLNQKKDLLVKLNEMIPWEAFRLTLERLHDKPRKSKGGRLCCMNNLRTSCSPPEI